MYTVLSDNEAQELFQTATYPLLIYCQFYEGIAYKEGSLLSRPTYEETAERPWSDFESLVLEEGSWRLQDGSALAWAKAEQPVQFFGGYPIPKMLGAEECKILFEEGTYPLYLTGFPTFRQTISICFTSRPIEFSSFPCTLPARIFFFDEQQKDWLLSEDHWDYNPISGFSLLIDKACMNVPLPTMIDFDSLFSDLSVSGPTLFEVYRQRVWIVHALMRYRSGDVACFYHSYGSWYYRHLDRTEPVRICTRRNFLKKHPLPKTYTVEMLRKVSVDSPRRKFVTVNHSESRRYETMCIVTKFLDDKKRYPIRAQILTIDSHVWRPQTVDIFMAQPREHGEVVDDTLPPMPTVIIDPQSYIMANCRAPFYIEGFKDVWKSQWNSFVIVEMMPESFPKVKFRGYVWENELWSPGLYEVDHIRESFFEDFMERHPVTYVPEQIDFAHLSEAHVSEKFVFVDCEVDTTDRWEIVAVPRSPDLANVTFPYEVKKGYIFASVPTDTDGGITHRWMHSSFTILRLLPCIVTRELPPIGPFMRVKADQSYHYGDGGDVLYRFPILWVPKLDYPLESTNQLVSLLRQIKEYRNFQHPNAIVKDIIDPDFYPIFVKKTWFAQRMEFREFVQSSNCDIRDRIISERHLADHEGTAVPRILGPAESTSSGSHDSNLSGSIDMEDREPLTRTTFRDTFQWQPCSVLFSQSSVKFITGIPDYPIYLYKDLYRQLETLLAYFIQPFQDIGVLSGSSMPVFRQVIIKAQEYIIPARTAYDGNLHREGKTENIKAVAVHYLSLGDIKGGNLEFCNSVLADGRVEEHEAKCEVLVTEGTSVAFENNMFHRALRIENQTDSIQHRLFINFFVVDPDLPIKLKTCYNTLRMILSKRFPGLVVDLILYHYGFPASPHRFRLDVKRDMMAVKPASIRHDYGNAGVTILLDDWRNYRTRFVGSLHDGRDFI